MKLPVVGFYGLFMFSACSDVGGAPGGEQSDQGEERDCQDSYWSLRCLMNMYNWERNFWELLVRSGAGGRLDPLDGIRALAFLWVSELHMMDMLSVAQFEDDLIITTGAADDHGDDDHENSYFLQGTKEVRPVPLSALNRPQSAYTLPFCFNPSRLRSRSRRVVFATARELRRIWGHNVLRAVRLSYSFHTRQDVQQAGPNGLRPLPLAPAPAHLAFLQCTVEPCSRVHTRTHAHA